MTIKNADMPAMPTQCLDHNAAMNGLAATVTDAPGFTKREKLAAMADVDSVFAEYFESYTEMLNFLGEEAPFSFDRVERKIAIEMRVKAKLRLMDADALLQQLEKGEE